MKKTTRKNLLTKYGIALVSIAFLASAGPPNPAPKKPPTRVGDLNKTQKRSRYMSKKKIKTLRAAAVQLLRCDRCNGTGKVQQIFKTGGTAGKRHTHDKMVTCDKCYGEKIYPQQGLYDKLDLFYRQCDKHDRAYPFDAPTAHDLEKWIARKVVNFRTINVLNEHVADRLRLRRIDNNQVVMVGFEIDEVDDIQGMTYGFGTVFPPVIGEQISLTVLFPDDSSKIKSGQQMFIILKYDGAVDLPGFGVTHVFTAKHFKLRR